MKHRSFRDSRVQDRAVSKGCRHADMPGIGNSLAPPTNRGSRMKVNRICIEALVFGTAIAFGCALLIATLAAATVALTQPADAEVSQSTGVSQTARPVQPSDLTPEQTKTFEGMVTCSQCGAKHAAALGRNASDCARRCVRSGASFALIDGERIYTLDGDLMAIKKVAGERARVVGAIHGNTIQVTLVATAN
jgi:hypothetical protein